MSKKVKNTSPLTLKDEKGNAVAFLKRKFLGNLFPKNGFEKAELKAYVKGHSRFGYGRDANGNPAYHETRQEYYYQ